MLEIITFIGVFFVGACFTFVGAMILWRNTFFQQHGIKIYGRIVDFSSETKDSSRRLPIIEYQFQAQKRRFVDQFSGLMTPVKMNQNIEIYVFQSHLDTAMTVHFIEEIKAVGYIFTAIGLVTCIVGLVVANVYFKDGIELAKISVAHPMFYAELFFSIMFFIAVIKAASAFSEIFKIALTGIPLEKNTDLVDQ